MLPLHPNNVQIIRRYSHGLQEKQCGVRLRQKLKINKQLFTEVDESKPL